VIKTLIFFHKTILKRARKNNISHLTNSDGTSATTPQQIEATFPSYFTNVFQAQHQRPPLMPTDISDNPLIQSQDDDHTYSTPDLQEIQAIIKAMSSNASPGADDISAGFYKSSWEWVCLDIMQVVTEFYRTATLPTGLNNTFLTLIPKKLAPTIPQDFRPISLCNVIYKIIAKSFANRIKDHLPNLIHPNQSAFIQGRRISINIILTQEIIHSFNLSSWNQKAFLLKVDFAKAFDRISWNFIVHTLAKYHFNAHFISMLHACISTTSMQVLVNGKPSDYLYPTRGIRQDCPLSPYLFVIAINKLSDMLQTALQTNNIAGVTLGDSGPHIHSLLFPDDLIIYGQATMTEVTTIKTIIDQFCQDSSQTPNLTKSTILFSKKVPPATINSISSIFPVPTLNPNTIHLGHPLLFSHKDRNRAYVFILNKFRAKLTTIKANSLNHAGRLTYINSILASIPVYYLSIVLFPKNSLTKSQLVSENSGGQEFKKTMLPLLFLTDHGKIFAKQKIMVARRLGTFI
jgi:hypothetical protein